MSYDRIRRPGYKPIGRELIEAGVITREQLNEGLRSQKHRRLKLVDTLICLGHLDPDRFTNFLAKQPGTPSVNLRNYRIDRRVVNLLPEGFIRAHDVLPLDRLGKLLTVAMGCPRDRRTVAEIENATGLDVKPLLCKLSDIRAVIDRHFDSAYLRN